MTSQNLTCLCQKTTQFVAVAVLELDCRSSNESRALFLCFVSWNLIFSSRRAVNFVTHQFMWRTVQGFCLYITCKYGINVIYVRTNYGLRCLGGSFFCSNRFGSRECATQSLGVFLIHENAWTKFIWATKLDEFRPALNGNTDTKSLALVE